MTLRGATDVRTICEVLREINDILQGKGVHKDVLPLLKEAEQMGKKMAKKLVEYNKDVFAGWWRKNPDYAKDLKRRMDATYIS